LPIEPAARAVADAYARATGGVGVVLTSSGPGVSNTITGIALAKGAYSPVISLGGATKTAFEQMGAKQEIDQLGLMRPVTKEVLRINRPDRSIIPLVESDNALANLTQFTSIAALEAVFMGVGDLARLQGVAADVRDPKMARVLRDAVNVCSQTGVTVMCSTGRSETLDEILTSVDMLWEIGVKVIWVPNPSHIAFKLYRTIMDRIR
jgi:hypothetical protein